MKATRRPAYRFATLCAVAMALALGCATARAQSLRRLDVDAARVTGEIRSLQGTAGYPGPGLVASTAKLPDFSGLWRDAGVDFVRTYDWRARLDTVDSPDSLFPHWAADPDAASSYNFAATDAWIKVVRDIGAEVMFTLATEIPHNSKPAADLEKYQRVVTHIVEHYTHGWANGMNHAVRYWEFSDQPDFYKTHFDGTPADFVAMYAAIAHAVKSVDPDLQMGGPNLAFALNQDSGFREGFLDAVRRDKLPLDFISWIWFSDSSYDPLDFVRVARTLQEVLDQHGFKGTAQILASFNLTGVPTPNLDLVQAAAFQVAALTYLQDAPVARAVLFRGDNGFDPNYQFVDPDHMFDQQGQPDARARGFVLNGRMQRTRQRLAVSGGDDKGFAVLAGRSGAGDTVQVLVANYAIPSQYLQPGKSSYEFTIPVGTDHAHISFQLLPRRTDAAESNNDGYDLTIRHLPWGRRPYTITRYRVDGTHEGEVVGTERGSGGAAHVRAVVPAPAIELIELRVAP